MEENTPIEAPSNTEESIISKEETESVLQPENIEIPKLSPSVEVENKIDQEMPLLDEPPQLSAEEGPQIVNNTNLVENPTEVTMELPQTTEVSETTTELSEPTVELPQAAVEAAEEGNTSVELPESVSAEIPENIIETHSAEEVNTSNTEVVNVDNSDIVEIKDEDAPEGDKQEFTDGNTSNPEADFQITELSETEYTVEEVAMEQNTSGETTESAMEAENAVAQIIVPDEPVVEEQTGPTITEMEDGPTITEMEDGPTMTEMEDDHILIENDVSFPSESQEESAEEANTSTEIPPNVEYHVVLNDSEVIAVNGMPQLTKEEEVGVYESEVINDVTIPGSEVPNPETTAIISLPSDTVTEVTYTDVQVLEAHDGLVTINDLNEQTEQEVVILQDDNVVVMETEEYDHPESIEVNVLDNQNADESEPKEEAEQDQDETKPVKIPCHVLGRNIENPLEDPVRNGRVLLKPRLGVKIPYRNLTSQIVSKQEIADEIMERSRLRQSSAEPPVGGDVFFAKKLTQRLAKKLSSPTKTPTKSSTKTTASASSTSSSSTSSSSSSKKVTNSSSKTVSSTKSQVTPKPQTTVAVTKVQASPVVTPKVPNNSAPKVAPPVDTSGKITDNSDLIALLEGDDDTEWPMMGLKNDASTSNKTTQKKSADSPKSPKKSSEWERETALKQLRELPIKSKYSSTKSGSSSKDLVLAPKSSPVSPPQNANKEPSKPEVKESAQNDDPLEELKDDLNVEPRFSSSSVMKTYTRKRKPSEDIKPFLSSTLIPSLKKAVAVTEQKQPSSVSKSTTVSSQKQSSASVQKHSSTSPQKSSSQKPSITSSTPKPSVTSSTPKSSSNVSGQKTIQKAPTAVQKSSSSSNIPKVSSSAAPKATSTPNLPKVTSVQKTSDSEKKQPLRVSDKVTSTQKTSDSEKKQPVSVSDKKPTAAPPKSVEATPAAPTEQKKTLSPNTYISKSSRIVKRKKIWDPDEATPAFKLSAIKSPKSQEAAPEKPAEKKVNKQVAVLKPSNEKRVEKSASPIPKTIEKKVAKPVSVLKPNNEKSPSKKVIMKKVIVKKKKPKRLTEVDRLLMDEGAVNLLYSVKNTEELQNLRKKKKKTVYSIDRAQRELLNKTNEIKNDLQINSTKDSPISLRKKEGATPKTSPLKDLAATILQRKKSKDSISGSVHSPPASPGFGYAQHAEASRIIRRHSSSSFSSENMDTDENRVTEKSSKHKSSESPKKKLKSSHEKRGSAGIGIDKQLLNEEMSKNFNKAPDDPKYSRFETFCVRKFDNLCQIILATTSTNGQTTLSTQVLAELALVLDILQKDDSCRVVLISSSGNSFCQGIDYKEMVSDDKEERRSIAENFAVCVKNFLMSLSKFTKILVAGVHGNAIGLGVTMLPLFDMVLASDTATFCTPYAQLGCAAEGGVLLTLPHVMHNALASELFFASRKLTAAEALRLGLVTRTLWPDKFQEELISALKIISSQSLQSMQAIKKQLRHHLLQNVENSLKSESNTLIQHWTSTECQNNFSDYSLDSK